MTSPQQQQQVDRLWELQELTRRNVQDLADQMAAIAAAGVLIPQSRWDQINGSWEQANKRMQDVGAALAMLHGL